MNRGRLRRYALRVLAAASLGVSLVVAGSGIAHADTFTGPNPTYHGKVIHPAGTSTADETVWN